jgi:hypothetical protein
MSYPNPSAALLVRRLLWNTSDAEAGRVLPTVVLLGPSGAGKTNTLASISELCSNYIIHADHDFASETSHSTIDTLLDLSIQLSRKWSIRGSPWFIRFALALVAIHVTVDDPTPDGTKRAIDLAVKRFKSNRRPCGWDQRIDSLINLINASTPLPVVLYEKIQPWIKFIQPLIKMVVPSIAGAASQQRIRLALDWHSAFRNAQGTAPIDALVRLSGLYNNDRKAATEWFVEAFLADVRESYTRTVRADAYLQNCPCIEVSKRQDHTHNWLLLLDNVDHPNGQQFLTDLTRARVDHRRSHPDERDPVVVIATSGRWSGPWTAAWCPPWIIPKQDPNQRLPVARCSNAGYTQWTRDADTIQNAIQREYYPVLLNNLDSTEVAARLSAGPNSLLCHNVLCATGGLPGAVARVAEALESGQLTNDTLDISALSSSKSLEHEPCILWSSALEKLELDCRPLDIKLDDVIDATPYLTAPWLVPTDSAYAAKPILEQLRANLWATTPSYGSELIGDARIHPWVGRLLLLALRARNNDDYASRFVKFRAELGQDADVTHLNYCDLAVGEIASVASRIADEFEYEPHALWISELAQITRAPYNMPVGMNVNKLAMQLIDQNLPYPTGEPTGTILKVVTRLLIASWLYGDPVGAPDAELHELVVTHLHDLARLSHQADLTPLYNAAELLAPLPRPHS